MYRYLYFFLILICFLSFSFFARRCFQSLGQLSLGHPVGCKSSPPTSKKYEKKLFIKSNKHYKHYSYSYKFSAQLLPIFFSFWFNFFKNLAKNCGKRGKKTKQKKKQEIVFAFSICDINFSICKHPAPRQSKSWEYIVS